MNSKLLALAWLALPANLVLARQLQQANPPSASAIDGPDGGQSSPYQITARGLNHRVWSTVGWTTNRHGIVVAHTNASYTEISAGLHHLVGNQLVESSPQFQIAASGAEATNAAHKVALLGNANGAGAVDITMSDSKHLTGSVLGLSYYDTASGESVMIGEIKDCQGQLLPSGNEALYPDAFSGIKADLLYLNQIGGLEQFAVLREQLPSPAAWDLNPATTVLELITEFTSAPQPQISTVPLAEATDYHLSFGQMQMGRGYAFAFGSETNKVRVRKQWLLMEGRQCLVEQVPFQQIEAQLGALPPSSSGGASLKASPDSILHRVVRRDLEKTKVASGLSLSFPHPAAAVAGESKAARPASAEATADKQHRPTGLGEKAVAERRALPGRKQAGKAAAFKIAATEEKEEGFALDYNLWTSQTNFTFEGDTTYYVSAPLNLRGTTTIEGGTVIKFTNTACSFTLWDTVVCKTGPFRPATLTAKDDDSIGSVITGSTGNPTGFYGGGIDNLTSVCPLSNLRFFFANQAFQSELPLSLTNCQFVHCNTAFEGQGGLNTIGLYNVLLYSVGTVFSDADPLTANVQNVTAHLCNTFADAGDGGSGSSVVLTNCLLVGVTNWGNVAYTTNSTAYLASDSGVFQTIGAAGHYLAADSPYRNAGSTNIDAGLLADLQRTTTYPPLVYSNVILTVNMTFGPQAQRDTDTPDLGYHYDPLDYAFKWVRISGATVQLQAGTAIGAFGPYGMAVWAGAQLVSQGTPTSLNHIARYNLVQEDCNTNWDGKGDLLEANWLGGSPDAQATWRFTDCSIPANDGCHFQNAWGNTIFNGTDCQFHGGTVHVDGYNILFTNNLLERVAFSLTDNATDLYPMVRNCLFLGGNLSVDDEDSTPWTFRDNLFDQTTNNLAAVDADYNGYTPGTTRLTTGAHDVLASAIYRTGPLGNYYQTNTSAFINVGSTTADAVGLYHYTTQTNQTVEATSTVDIGFHYVAVDGNGNPIDSVGDGLPDYLEEINGNGLVDSGETDWQSASDLGLKVYITRPRTGSDIP